MPLVVVTRVASLSEAHVITAALRWGGIVADVCDANLGQMDWFYQNALGGFRVVIPGDSLDDAIDMLRQLRARPIAAEEDRG